MDAIIVHVVYSGALELQILSSNGSIGDSNDRVDVRSSVRIPAQAKYTSFLGICLVRRGKCDKTGGKQHPIKKAGTLRKMLHPMRDKNPRKGWTGGGGGTSTPRKLGNYKCDEKEKKKTNKTHTNTSCTVLKAEQKQDRAASTEDPAAYFSRHSFI